MCPDHGFHNHGSEESVCPLAFSFTVFITLDFSPPKIGVAWSEKKMRLNLKIICTCVQPVRLYAWYTCFSVQPHFYMGLWSSSIPQNPRTWNVVQFENEFNRNPPINRPEKHAGVHNVMGDLAKSQGKSLGIVQYLQTCFVRVSSNYIQLQNWGKTHKILSKDGEFESPSSLYLLATHLLGIVRRLHSRSA